MSKLKVDEALDLRVDANTRLKDIDPTSTPGLKTKGADLEDDIEESLEIIAEELAELQEMLYANHRAGTEPGSILIVLQGMDTSGKGGALKSLYRHLDPQGIQLAAFGTPTEEELQHDFLWRIRRQLPEPGKIAIFDRSHYEDVLVHRVEGLSSPEVIEQRYSAITEFEKALADNGTRVLKFMLHISPEFQKENLLDRLDKPEKHWKYSPGDIDTRAKWAEYQEAYEIAIQRTSTDHAPWFILPSDNKDYARLAIHLILLHTLRQMDLSWPKAAFDVEKEKERVKGLPDNPND